MTLVYGKRTNPVDDSCHQDWCLGGDLQSYVIVRPLRHKIASAMYRVSVEDTLAIGWAELYHQNLCNFPERRFWLHRVENIVHFVF